MISASAIEQSATVASVANNFQSHFTNTKQSNWWKTEKIFGLKRRDYHLLFKRTPSIIDINCLIAISKADSAFLLNFDIGVIDSYQIQQRAPKLYWQHDLAPVIKNRTGIPWASTARCIFVLIPASDLLRQAAARGRAEHFAHKARYRAEETFHAFLSFDFSERLSIWRVFFEQEPGCFAFALDNCNITLDKHMAKNSCYFQKCKKHIDH